MLICLYFMHNCFFVALDSWWLWFCTLNRLIMPEDEFHKLADETIHDLLEKLEVMNLWYGLQVSALKESLSVNILNRHTFGLYCYSCLCFRNMVTPFRWMVSTLTTGLVTTNNGALCEFLLLFVFIHWIIDASFFSSSRIRFWHWGLGIWEHMLWTSKHQTDKSGYLHLWGTTMLS
jgi:hypothetical protein